MTERDVDYSFSGVSLQGLFVSPEASGPVPGVLVVHDAGGLSANIREKARQVARLGYAAFALDMFGGGKPSPDGMQRIRALAGDFAQWTGLLQAGLDQLLAQPGVDSSRVAAIGYCFGGTSVYELARTGVDLKAAVGFHSGLVPSSGNAKNITGKVLCLIGADDPIIPADKRLAWEQEMTAAKVDWQMNLYGKTGHSFTNPDINVAMPGFAYSKDADARSWAEMRRLFAEVFGA